MVYKNINFAFFYEMTGYGNFHAFAAVLGLTNASRVLKGILDQEKAADQALLILPKSAYYAAYEAAGDDEDPQGLTKALKK